MILMSAYKGMRLGELTALQWSDVGSDYLHTHRQQIVSEDSNGNRVFLGVSYTKDERTHPHDGRFFPISDEIRAVLSYAQEIRGNSAYVFHDPDKPGFILKDSVETNERAYSHSDKRRLEKISACLLLQQEKTRKL